MSGSCTHGQAGGVAAAGVQLGCGGAKHLFSDKYQQDIGRGSRNQIQRKYYCHSPNSTSNRLGVPDHHHHQIAGTARQIKPED